MDKYEIKLDKKADVRYFDIDGVRYYITANKMYVRKDNGFIASRNERRVTP